MNLKMREIYKKKKMARTRAVPRQRPNVNPQQRPNVVKIKFLLLRVKDIEVKYKGNVVAVLFLECKKIFLIGQNKKIGTLNKTRITTLEKRRSMLSVFCI